MGNSRRQPRRTVAATTGSCRSVVSDEGVNFPTAAAPRQADRIFISTGEERFLDSRRSAL